MDLVILAWMDVIVVGGVSDVPETPISLLFEYCSVVEIVLACAAPSPDSIRLGKTKIDFRRSSTPYCVLS